MADWSRNLLAMLMGVQQGQQQKQAGQAEQFQQMLQNQLQQQQFGLQEQQVGMQRERLDMDLAAAMAPPPPAVPPEWTADLQALQAGVDPKWSVDEKLQHYHRGLSAKWSGTDPYKSLFQTFPEAPTPPKPQKPFAVAENVPYIFNPDTGTFTENPGYLSAEKRKPPKGETQYTWAQKVDDINSALSKTFQMDTPFAKLDPERQQEFFSALTTALHYARQGTPIEQAISMGFDEAKQGSPGAAGLGGYSDEERKIMDRLGLGKTQD